MTEQTVFYTRNEQGEYQPVSYWDSQLMDAFPVGKSMLVTVSRNCTARRECVDPDFVALQAAAQHLQIRNQLGKILQTALKGRPDSAVLTDHQKELLGQLRTSGIDRWLYPSIADSAERILQLIIDAAKPAVQVPWVQEAAEQYRAAVALTMQQNSTNND
jgi:hypothetical protein